jgi:hypothetical protein
MTQRNFLLAAAAIVLLAFGLLRGFVLTMTVPEPNQGDVSDYLRYALHLAMVTAPSRTRPIARFPDAYRSPGYPWLCGPVAGRRLGRWPRFARVYQVPGPAGRRHVGFVIALARAGCRAATRCGRLADGAQAHNVAASGALPGRSTVRRAAGGLAASLSHSRSRRASRGLGALAGAASDWAT